MTISVTCTADVCCTEIPEIQGPNAPSRVRKLVDRYSEIGRTLASPLDDVTSSGSRGQSPVPEVVGSSEETLLEVEG